MSRVDKSIETESGFVVPGIGGVGRGGNGESLFNGREVSFGDDENVLEIIELMLSQRCECTRCLWLMPWKVVNLLTERFYKIIIQMRDGGGFQEGGSSGGGEM